MKEWKDINLEEDEIVFSLDVEKMFTNLKREEIKKEIEKLIEEKEEIRGWKKEEIIKNLEYTWDNTYCTVEEEGIKIEEGLGIGSIMSPVLAEIIMKRWEKEKIEGERRIRNFRRYVDNSIGIWRGGKDTLEERVKEMEDEKKGIQLKLEVEKDKKITFLDIELERRRKDEGVRMKWYQKKENAGI